MIGNQALNTAVSLGGNKVSQNYGVDTDLSPVEQLIQRLAKATESANVSMTDLVVRLIPVSSESAVGEAIDKSPANPLSQIVHRLTAILEEVERLNRRINDARNELRI